jgi:hypothetical protein
MAFQTDQERKRIPGTDREENKKGGTGTEQISTPHGKQNFP